MSIADDARRLMELKERLPYTCIEAAVWEDDRMGGVVYDIYPFGHRPLIAALDAATAKTEAAQWALNELGVTLEAVASRHQG